MKKYLLVVSFLAVVLLAIAGPALAAEGDTAYDPTVTQAILAGIGGIITVQGLTTYLMKLVKNATETMKKILGYLFSMVSSAVVTAAYLAITKAFSVQALLMYGAAVWFVASGLYDTYHPKKPA